MCCCQCNTRGFLWELHHNLAYSSALMTCCTRMRLATQLYCWYTLPSCLDIMCFISLECLFFYSTAEELDEGGVAEKGEDIYLAEEQSCLLLCHILQCLTKCFLYDKTQFLTKERFDSLLQPLVDQVSYECRMCVCGFILAFHPQCGGSPGR